MSNTAPYSLPVGIQGEMALDVVLGGGGGYGLSLLFLPWAQNELATAKSSQSVGMSSMSFADHRARGHSPAVKALDLFHTESKGPSLSYVGRGHVFGLCTPFALMHLEWGI